MNGRLAGLVWLLVLCANMEWANKTWADLIPPGHKSVHHELVFEDSALLAENRLIAAPTAGFHGVVVIKPGERFSFSSKYGTEFYLVPKDEPLPTDFERETFSKWFHCSPPVQEISSVPWTSPVAKALTVLTLDTISETGPVITVVSHSELDSAGNPAGESAGWNSRWIIGSTVVLVGLGLCVVARRWFWHVYSVRDGGRSSEMDLADRNAG
jgi:hypothetical protein